MASKQQVATVAKTDTPASDAGSVEKFTPGRAHGVVSRIAARFGVDSDKMLETLKQTAFRQRAPKGVGAVVPVSNEQMMMLLVVADQYHLNPFTREIYAFPSEGGIVPIVSVDGWIRIINEHPQIEAIEFEMAPPGTEDPWISCTITRKDRSKPTTVTEYLTECTRATDPWRDMPRRMLRHKALIQCARVSFGFAGIFDPDEADKIVATIEAGTIIPRNMKPATKEPQRKESAIQTAPGLSVDQITALRDSLQTCKVDESALLARFEVGELADLAAGQYEDALNTIDELAA